MDYKEFKEYYDKLNDEEVKKCGSEADNFTWTEYYPGEHKVEFLEKFTKVFKGFALSEVAVDENLGFIVCNEDMYIGETFLDDCLDDNIFGEEAYDKYYKDLEDYMNKN